MSSVVYRAVIFLNNQNQSHYKRVYAVKFNIGSRFMDKFSLTFPFTLKEIVRDKYKNNTI